MDLLDYDETLETGKRRVSNVLRMSTMKVDFIPEPAEVNIPPFRSLKWQEQAANLYYALRHAENRILNGEISRFDTPEERATLTDVVRISKNRTSPQATGWLLNLLEPAEQVYLQEDRHGVSATYTGFKNEVVYVNPSDNSRWALAVERAENTTDRFVSSPAGSGLKVGESKDTLVFVRLQNE